MKFIFCQQTKRQRFLQIDTIILAVCDQAYPNPQNNKFAISLQYLKKKVSDGVSFLHEDKHVSFLQIDTIILMGMVKQSQKEVRNGINFLHADKHQSFYKLAL